MIEYRIGNPLDTDAEALVLPVKACGDIEHGLIAAAAARWPTQIRTFMRENLREGKLRLGRGVAYYLGSASTPRYLLPVVTQEHWMKPSKLVVIYDCIAWLTGFMEHSSLTSLAIPAIGCGSGRMQWEAVEAEILRRFWDMRRVDLQLYPPGEAKGLVEVEVGYGTAD